MHKNSLLRQSFYLSALVRTQVEPTTTDRWRFPVNNAGLQREANFTEIKPEQWNFAIGVNLTGQLLCAREPIRGFSAEGVDARNPGPHATLHEVIPRMNANQWTKNAET